ncbi:MAG: type 4a pilus biogenesis protein PilO [Candidatus Hydrogenedentota bacterium]
MIDFLKGTITPRDWAISCSIAAIAVAIAVGFYLVVNSNQTTKLEAIQASDAQIMKDLDQARQIERNIGELEAQTSQIKALVSQFEERLPTEREIVTLIVDFETMGGEEDVKVSLDRLEPSRDERKETIPYNVIARGTFHQVTSFINRLERFRRYLKVTGLSVTRTQDGATEARFTLNTYRFLQGSPS